ncbi:MAG TPA: hypothetical protein VI451_20090 [Anaerolineales bacterium]|jgi:hypothetical protein|nr:hypothetical protein [Anaerolineales bacterium]
MARKPAIPLEIKEEVFKIVEEFNRKHFSQKQHPLIRMLYSNPKRGYVARFKGKFLYLDHTDYGRASEICRLTWKGQMDHWDFAIYRHTRNFYDPDEWMFPGAQHVDGTVEGAMKAGMEAYPM